MKTKFQLKLSIFVSIIGVIALVVGVSYAIFVSVINSSKNQIIKTGSVALGFTEITNGLQLTDMNEMTDSDGLNQTSFYQFNVSNPNNTKVKYKILLIDDTAANNSYGGTVLDDSYIRVGLEEDGIELGPMNLEDVNRIIKQGSIDDNTTKTYKLRLWLNLDGLNSTEKQALLNQEVYYKVKIESEQSFDEEPPVCTFTNFNQTTYVYTLECTDASPFSDGVILSSDLETDLGVTVSNITTEIIPNGFRYLITLSGISDITLKANSVGDIARNKNEVASHMILDRSGANVPELVQGMIPVYYDGTNWRKADSTNFNASYKWYDYNDKMWANAVTVTATNRTTIEDAPLGTPISMDDINTMWVWIPRYSYTINDTTKGTNTGTDSKPIYLNPGAIDIKFVNTNTVETGTAQYTGTTATNYNTLQAFFWDIDGDRARDTNEEKSGIWFAKFGTGHSSPSSSLGCTDTSCANGSGIIIKPDVQSLRSNDVSNYFLGARSMQVAHYNIYGFANDSTYDVHMLKNDEWAAAAYLSQSIYGRCTSSSSCTEVYINNSSDYYTGRSGGNVSGSTPINGTYTGQTSTEISNTYGFYTYDGYLLEYNTNTKSSTRDMSKVASTTGNIYGIYDMSGLIFEYVMGNYNDYSGRTFDDSGFNGTMYSLYDGSLYTKTDGVDFFGITSNNKYYNKYTDPPFNGNASQNLTYCTQATCGGYALTETLGWYSDYPYFIYWGCPWFARGSSDATDKSRNGLFAFQGRAGSPEDNYGTRYAIIK